MIPADIAKRFAGKKITLMGLGLLGRGIGDARFFAKAGADLIVTDLKTEQELAPSMEQLKEFSNITYHLGGHRMEDFENRDLILRANNAPLDSPFIAHARERGIPIEMDAALFAKLCTQYFPTATIIGITGTRGKSTTTHLIYKMIKAAGKRVFLGGNEKDTATLSLLETIQDGDAIVLELDSWQLQGFEEDKISPHISVWTNFMPDHMNYYKNDLGRYFRDKAAIARFQTDHDYFITAKSQGEMKIKEKIELQFGTLKATSITNPLLPQGWEVGLPGEHNLQNAACAYAAAKCANISDEVIKKALKEFKALPGRLELLGEKNDIEFYNDSNSTTPDAGIVALKTLAAKHKPIILIAGGNDKELSFESFADEIKKNVTSAVFFNGKATEKITALLPKDFPYATASSMEEACNAALKYAKPDSIILLSPAATSFGIFKNEYDRGDQFVAWFKKLA